MKKIILCAISLSVAATATMPFSARAIGESSAFLYRLYNARTGDHFYTASTAERDAAIRSSGYRDEGIAGSILTVAATSTTPLFRLFNASDGDHFYTTSAVERDTATADGYRSEGALGFVYTTQVVGTAPFMRLYNSRTRDHFYTTDMTERLNAANLGGYTYEGNSGFIPDRLFNLIRVASVSPGKTLTSPLTITGEARGNWFFEASFPVNLLDNTGKVIISGPAQATQNSMTTNFVPFTFGPTAFTVATGTTQGFLILSKDNPSGLLQNADQLVIPVGF